GKTLHLFVHTGHSYQSVGIAWIDVQDFLKFSQSEIVLTEILVQEAQRDEHGRQVLVDFDGFATICKSLLNGGRVVIHQEFQAIGFAESRETQSKARILFYGSC